MTELNSTPCPLCKGDTASFYLPASPYHGRNGGYYIRCICCDMARMRLYQTSNNAIKYWNEWNIKHKK
jgi:hypothetical protein